MSADTISLSADAAAGASRPAKRELEGPFDRERPFKVMMTTDAPQSAPPTSSDITTKEVEEEKATISRKVRLEQNRKAAKESRRRKKVMIEELQRSVIFFSRANSALKQHNDELMRLLLQAQSVVSSNGDQTQSAKVINTVSNDAMEQAEAEAVAAQALYESQGFSAAAAREAAQTMKGTGSKTVENNVNSAIPDVQTGATMQAMASFQQAATAAMQAAMQGINHAIPGLSMGQLAATPAGANAQQAYTDTITAMAMQQAAAAAGQQFGTQLFMDPMFSWQHAFSASTTPFTPSTACAAKEEETAEL